MSTHADNHGGPHLAGFSGQLLLLGFGCIGRAVLPLLLRHLAIRPEQITVLSARGPNIHQARAAGVQTQVLPLTPDNYLSVLDRLLKPGDCLLNLSVNVSSLALIEYCLQHQLLYLDAAIEPWGGGHFDTSVPPAHRSNYAYREAALALRRRYPDAATALVNHGMNPGLISHFTKQALLNLAADQGLAARAPRDREAWARLAQQLGVKTIHVSERDTQLCRTPKARGEFVNTWSSEAFVDESCQPAELGWGSHERHWPACARRYGFGADCAIYLNQPGAATRVRSWAPSEGPFHGFLVSHGESISMADYFTVREAGQVIYRPTVHYAYHPCDHALLSLHELAGKNWQMQARRRLLLDDITEGMDELGVLLMGHSRGAYWYGSQLGIDQARALAPDNSATSLQVTAGVLAGLVWVLRHPRQGLVEPDQLDFEAVMAVALPYLGPMVGVYRDWTPVAGRGQLFEEELDRDDPWQFTNFLV